MEKNNYTQYGDQSKPVRWLIHLSQKTTREVEKYALKNNLSENEVIRRGVENLLMPFASVSSPVAKSKLKKG